MKQTVSVVISVYNKAASLERCLTSLGGFADEIIVVDNTSTDNTVAVAKKFTKLVFTKQNQLMLNTNKNFGFTKATGDWIVNLDDDEVIPVELAKEIKKVIASNPEENGFWIKRKNYSFGKWIQHGLWWPDKQLRLFRNKKGKFPCVHIHEYIEVEGKVGELEEPYIHYNYESVSQYLAKIDRASTSEAITLTESNYQLAWYDALRFPISDFIKIYFAEGGFKDGLHGLVLALFQAFYSFCTFAKKWEMDKYEERDIQLNAVSGELHERAKEISYWTLTASMRDSKNIVSNIIKKIRRKSLTLKK